MGEHVQYVDRVFPAGVAELVGGRCSPCGAEPEAMVSLVPKQLRLRTGTGDHLVANDAVELAGRTLGLVGYGRIGRRLGRAAAALDMDVIACDPYLDPKDMASDVELVLFPQLLARADVISVHAPLSDDTQRLFDVSAFAAMRPGVVFVNAARGGLVDQDALLTALDARHVGAAALDVTDPEPLPTDQPVLNRDDMLVTPHIASAIDVGGLHLFDHAIDNALAVLADGAASHVVNPEVLERVR